MRQEMKDGAMHDFETLSEREKRLKVTAVSILDICKNDNLTISEYKRTLEILDSMVCNTIIHGQLNV